MRRLILLAAVLALAACSSKSGKDKDIDQPAKLVPFTPSLRIDRAWSAGVSNKGGEALRLGLGLAVDGGRVFAAGHKGEVAAFDLESGKQLWRTQTKAPLAGGTGVGDGIVAVGSSGGELLALNSSNGAVLWKVRLNGEVLAPPAVSARLVVVRTVDGKLHGLAPKDGHELWTQEQQVPRLSLRGTARPVLSGEFALCGFDNGKVVAVNVGDGSVQWEATVAPPHGRTELERLVDIDSAVKVSGQDVFAVGFQGRVAMLALDTGQIWWSHDASSYRGLALDDDALYMASSDGDVAALRRRTGAEIWQQKALLHRGLSTVVAMNDSVVVADSFGYVHWLEKTTGGFAGRVSTGKVRISNPPVVAGNKVLVINDAGSITAFRVSRTAAAKPAAPVAAEPAPGNAAEQGAPAPQSGPVAAPPTDAPAAPATEAPAGTAPPATPAEHN
jgi:outer membrane protein assembly factor BamB